jgi:hypothetical protein
MNVFGQSDLLFEYEYSNFIAPIYSRIELKFPNGKNKKIFSDTLSMFEYSQKNYLDETGKYTLKISFNSDKYGQDSINYDFELNGKETNIDISIKFDYNGKYYKEGDFWIKKEKVPQGYIRVFKYYKAPESIQICINEGFESNEYYKGPFFTLKNNTTDTIYGEHLPGYFWGTLFFLNEDFSVKKKWIGTIDYMFVDSPPLYPDSSKVATVGSFGVLKKLPPHKYKYELLYSTKYQSSGKGIGVYEDKRLFVWWAGTKEYYKIIYQFEIE